MASHDNLAPLGVAVVGLGRAGVFHLERIGLRTDCRIVAAYDECPSAMQKSAGLVPRLADSWSALLHDEGVDLVLVATPPASHAALTIEALSAGKHVLVETPLCLDLPAADAIVAAAERYDRSVIVAQTRRWDGEFQTVRQCVESGALGRLLAVKQIRWQYNRPPGVPAGHSSSVPPKAVDRLAPHDWRAHASGGGGTLWEFGAHELDQLLQLAGESPASVVAELFPGDRMSSVDDGYLILANFPSGLRAQVEFNRASPAVLQTGWVVVGSDGSYHDGTLLTVGVDGEVLDQPVPPATAAGDEFYAAVVRHLRGTGPNPVPAAEARRTVALIEAAQRSARLGAPLRVKG